MRFLMWVAIVVASLGFSAVAQTSGTSQSAPRKVRVKPSSSDANLKHSGGGKGVAIPKRSAGSSESRSLQVLERETARAVAGGKASHSKGKSGPEPKVVREKPNPPIKFNGRNGGGGSASGKAGNAYRGRLRQKGSHR